MASPWQNGRIEWFFGTFKEKWRQLDVCDCPNLQTELLIYQAWYNRLRPHQNLDGLTPKEVFQGKRRTSLGQCLGWGADGQPRPILICWEVFRSARFRIWPRTRTTTRQKNRIARSTRRFL
ncbi:integrase core domain-containing protein [Marinobacter sp.]|uniref:integrase core domain-containing protein n=1 Tax=Marinobacter sp. TaxID=50741 RepID=UPI0039C8F39F